MYTYVYIFFPFGHKVIYFVIFAHFVAVSRWRIPRFSWVEIIVIWSIYDWVEIIFIQTFSFALSLLNLIWQTALYFI